MKMPSVKTTLFAAAITILVALSVLMFRSCPKKTAVAFEMNSAEAAQGCGLLFFQDTSIYADHPLWAVAISNRFGVMTYLSHTDNSGHGMSDGDGLIIDGDCNHQFSVNFGYTVWSHCGVVDPPIWLHLTAGSWFEYYIASTLCVCPQAGHGSLSPVNVLWCDGQ